MTTDARAAKAELDRRAIRLAAERAALFDNARARFGLTKIEQARLRTIEMELDECFLARRRERAAIDAHRFERDGSSIRRVPRQSP